MTFGGWLPFIGFRWVDIDSNGMPTEVRTGWQASAFMVEWFGHGFVLFTTNVRQSSV